MLGTGALSSRPISSIPIVTTPAQITWPLRRARRNLSLFDEDITRAKRSLSSIDSTPTRVGTPLRRTRIDFGAFEEEITRPRRSLFDLIPASSSFPRAAQEVLENLVSDIPTPKASQFVTESLVYDQPDAARASQLVLEVLLPSISDYAYPIYPTLGVGFSVIKRPIWSTAQGVAGSGREIRLKFFPYPLWEWDLTYEYLPDEQANGFTASDLKTLMGFYLMTNGLLLPFLFTDPDDNIVVGQVQGVGDGATSIYTLFRTYGLAPYTGTEPVGYVNTNSSFNVYRDGVLLDPSRYTVITSVPGNQLLKLYDTPAPGVVITTDMSYYYYAKVPDDKMEFEKFMNLLWSLKKITLRSLRG